MNFLKATVICALVLGFASCEEAVEKPSDELIFKSISIPTQYVETSARISSEVSVFDVPVLASGEDGEEIVGVARVTMPQGNDEVLISFELSSNIMDAANLDTNFWVSTNDSSARILGIGGCLKDCGDDSIENPGWCKAGCWAEFALKVVVVVAVL